MRIFTVAALILSVFINAAVAESVAIGVPEYPKDLNVLTSPHIVGRLVRAYTFQTLTRTLRPLASATDQSSENQIRLGLAQSFQVSADYSQWSFRIRPDGIFSNGEKITPQDVVFSLRECSMQNILSEVSSVQLRNNEDSLVREESPWIDVVVEGTVDTRKGFTSRLAVCPIIQEATAVLFGRDLGLGSNVISSGPYRIRDFKSGSEMVLIKGGAGSEEGTGSITIKSFKDAGQALTALRVGTLDGFFTNDTSVLSKSSTDVTLLSEQCGDFSLVTRRGFKITCGNLQELSYVF